MKRFRLTSQFAPQARMNKQSFAAKTNKLSLAENRRLQIRR